VLANVPPGTPNRLLYSAVTGSPAPTTAPPPPAPAPTDTPPVASFTGSCAKGRCSFDAATSGDDNGIVSYAWDFGDGHPAVEGGSLVRTQHTFTSRGTYTVILTVRDSVGQRSTRSAAFTVRRI
jgi:PKD repeat protein